MSSPGCRVDSLDSGHDLEQCKELENGMKAIILGYYLTVFRESFRIKAIILQFSLAESE